jgi:thymidylate synthase
MLTYTKNELEVIEKALIPLNTKLQNGEIVAGTVELINAHLTLDPTSEYIDLGTIKPAPRKYFSQELNWYLSQNRYITGYVDNIEIWNKICTEDKKVNSNYGWCVFSPENADGKNSQYDYALKQLLAHPDGRQSVCFYNRPQMQWEWNDGVHAKHDFTCTFCTQHFIRNGKLEYIVYMRSNDAIFGLLGDFFWHCQVYKRFIQDLKDVQIGSIHWNAGSLHVYERHFDLLKKVVDEYDSRKTTET